MSGRKNMRKRLLWACLPLCLLFSSCQKKQSDIYMIEETLSDKEPEERSFGDTQEEKQEEQPKERIYVHVCGAVENPGVYALEAGIRGYLAVEAAGGFTLDASRDSVNLAQPLNDGEMLYIPTAEESEKMEKKAEAQSLGLVNINEADEKELMGLPGIGEVRAAQIVAYRNRYGDFQSPEELMQIEGIKDSVYAKLKDKITIE